MTCICYCSVAKLCPTLWPQAPLSSAISQSLLKFLLIESVMLSDHLIQFKKVGRFSLVQSLSCVWLFTTPWTVAHQASLSFTNSWSLLTLMSVELVMPSNHVILCRPFLLPSSFPSIRVFSNESALHIRWPRYWSFSFSISPSNEFSGLISFGMNSLDLLPI